MGRARAALEANKIFFETVTAVSLPVIGILIAIQSNSFARAQAESGLRQALVAETSVRPFFSFRIHIDTASSNDEVVEVQNIGAAIRNVAASHVEFVVVAAHPMENMPALARDSATVPLFGYYDSAEIPDSGTGVALRLRGQGKTLVRSLSKKLFFWVGNDTAYYISADVCRVISLEFTDRTGVRRRESYLLDNGGTHPMTDHAKALVDTFSKAAYAGRAWNIKALWSSDVRALLERNTFIGMNDTAVLGRNTEVQRPKPPDRGGAYTWSWDARCSRVFK